MSTYASRLYLNEPSQAANYSASILSFSSPPLKFLRILSDFTFLVGVSTASGSSTFTFRFLVAVPLLAGVALGVVLALAADFLLADGVEGAVVVAVPLAAAFCAKISSASRLSL